MKNKLFYIVILILLTIITIISMMVHTEPILSNSEATHNKEDIKERTLTTSSGVLLHIQNKYSSQDTTSEVIITTEGLSEDTELVVEEAKLVDILFSDINNDSYEEVVLIFSDEKETEGRTIKLFTTHNDVALLEIPVPEITTETTDIGGPFEGYVGYDTFSIKKSKLVHEFKTFTLGAPILKKKEHLEILKKQEEGRQYQETIASSTSAYTYKTPKVLGASIAQATVEETSLLETSQPSPYEDNSTQAPLEEKEEGSLFTRSLIYNLKDTNESFTIELEDYLEKDTQIVASSTYQLSGTAWEWISAVGQKNELITPVTKNTFALLFSSQEDFVLKTDCGELYGTYVAGGGFISFGNISKREHECPPYSQEDIYRNLLISSLGYSVRSNTLYLSLPGDRLMTFSK